jgi:hypothetical protein
MLLVSLLTFPATAGETDSTDPAPAQTAATPTTKLTHLSILIPSPPDPQGAACRNHWSVVSFGRLRLIPVGGTCLAILEVGAAANKTLG